MTPTSSAICEDVDHVVASDYMVRNHGYMVYDTLFALDDEALIKPQMVETLHGQPPTA